MKKESSFFDYSESLSSEWILKMYCLAVHPLRAVSTDEKYKRNTQRIQVIERYMGNNWPILLMQLAEQ